MDFSFFIELQISDIASNVDAYERQPQRASYFQRKTAYQVYIFRDRAQRRAPINPVKNRHWDWKPRIRILCNKFIRSEF